MPRGKRGHHGKHRELLEWQLFFEAADDRFTKRADFEAMIPSAREFFLRTGKDPIGMGVHVSIRWRNPESESDYSRQWKSSDDSDQNLDDAYATLKKAVLYGR